MCQCVKLGSVTNSSWLPRSDPSRKRTLTHYSYYNQNHVEEEVSWENSEGIHHDISNSMSISRIYLTCCLHLLSTLQLCNSCCYIAIYDWRRPKQTNLATNVYVNSRTKLLKDHPKHNQQTPRRKRSSAKEHLAAPGPPHTHPNHTASTRAADTIATSTRENNKSIGLKQLRTRGACSYYCCIIRISMVTKCRTSLGGQATLF